MVIAVRFSQVKPADISGLAMPPSLERRAGAGKDTCTLPRHDAEGMEIEMEMEVA